ncbi:MAG: hypothetical protein ACRD2E_08880 [Terriglobales bacterium]
MASGAEAEFGTPTAHYARASFGPFMCVTCHHFAFPHFCNHPKVIEDAKNKQGGLTMGAGAASVQLEGCCNYWRPK